MGVALLHMGMPVSRTARHTTSGPTSALGRMFDTALESKISRTRHGMYGELLQVHVLEVGLGIRWGLVYACALEDTPHIS
eukprot:784348-Amphidinium_carterae.1